MTRIHTLQTRLSGPVTQTGSIAWLQAREAKAAKTGHQDMATFLTARIKVRQEVLAILPDRLSELQAAQVLCAKTPTTSGSASTS